MAPRPKHNKIFPNDPLNCLVLARPGRGKTHLVFDILTTENMLDYNTLIIYTNNPNNKYYIFLDHGFKNKLKKEIINKSLLCFEENEETLELNQIPLICEHLAEDNNNVFKNSSIKVIISKNIKFDDIPKNKTIMIFDDMVTDKNQSLQETCFIRGREQNIGNFYLTQSFSKSPKIIRDSASCCIFFDIQHYDRLGIHRHFNTGMESKEFRSFCSEVLDGDERFQHIYINDNAPLKNRVIANAFSFL